MVLEDMKFFGRKPVFLRASNSLDTNANRCLGRKIKVILVIASTSHLGWYVFVLDFDNFIAVFDRQNTELEWITKKPAKHSDNLRSRA